MEPYETVESLSLIFSYLSRTHHPSLPRPNILHGYYTCVRSTWEWLIHYYPHFLSPAIRDLALEDSSIPPTTSTLIHWYMKWPNCKQASSRSHFSRFFLCCSQWRAKLEHRGRIIYIVQGHHHYLESSVGAYRSRWGGNIGKEGHADYEGL